MYILYCEIIVIICSLFVVQLHVLGTLVAAHLKEVRGRAHPVLPDGVEVRVRDSLLLAELPAQKQLIKQDSIVLINFTKLSAKGL